MKLSDTQLLILSSASQRTDHAALLPTNLKGSAAKRVVDRLLKEKLLQKLFVQEPVDHLLCGAAFEVRRQKRGMVGSLRSRRQNQ